MKEKKLKLGKNQKKIQLQKNKMKNLVMIMKNLLIQKNIKKMLKKKMKLSKQK